jgi:hypothetical protein
LPLLFSFLPATFKSQPCEGWFRPP